MTVKELREALAKLPEDAKVFTYSAFNEGDGWANKIYLCDKNSVSDDCMYQVKEYYCNGDSVVAYHLIEHPEDKIAVIAGLY